MVLLDCLIILILLLISYSAMQLLSLKMKGKLSFLPSVLSGVIMLGMAVILLSNGATLEELFLAVSVFGAVSVSIHYYYKPKAAAAGEEAADK